MYSLNTYFLSLYFLCFYVRLFVLGVGKQRVKEYYLSLRMIPFNGSASTVKRPKVLLTPFHLVFILFILVFEVPFRIHPSRNTIAIASCQ